MNTANRVARGAILTFVILALPVAAMADIVTLTAYMSGGNEVPAVATGASGFATLTLDTANGTLAAIPFHMEFTGLSSAETGAHIHQAPAGANGGVIVPLPLGSPVDTTIGLTLAQYAALAGEGLYVNVHTANFPGGEIRGQFVITSTVATDDASWGSVKALFR